MKQRYSRTYEGGRPTNGWERGERLLVLPTPGDVLIRVCHQFKAENLIRVMARPEDWSAVNVDRLFYYEYVDCRSVTRSDGDMMACWDWEFSDHPVAPRLATEIYRAIDRRPPDRSKQRIRADKLPAWLSYN